MTAALLPVWIIGGPFIGLLFLSFFYRGGTSNTIAMDRPYDVERSAEVGAISELSGHVSPGAISDLSGHVSPGAISALSAHKSVGAIAELSRRISPGAISRLSGHKSTGAISALSAPRPVGSIATLSDGWFVLNLLGLPLLTRSQAPPEPD